MLLHSLQQIEFASRSRLKNINKNNNNTHTLNWKWSGYRLSKSQHTHTQNKHYTKRTVNNSMKWTWLKANRMKISIELDACLLWPHTQFRICTLHTHTLHSTQLESLQIRVCLHFNVIITIFAECMFVCVELGSLLFRWDCCLLSGRVLSICGLIWWQIAVWYSGVAREEKE